ncbi:MAG: diguanylate cyclase, partial [Solirubrobacteraceae bacterium]|nr:diguanylate cyclase [Solirubrobacteraceae bacterium]
LRTLGVRLALDDFGTGWSSLTHLQRLPVDEIKIDRSFVAAMAAEARAAAIVSSTVDLAHAVGLRVVAEGIEDEATWSRLRAVGCDAAQGYYLSRPLPAGELEAGAAAIAERARIASGVARLTA